jgi:hypothetical protein
MKGHSQIGVDLVDEALAAMGWDVQSFARTKATSSGWVGPAQETVEFQSCVDLLIQSMKQRRAAGRIG